MKMANLLVIDIELKELVITGVSHYSTNIIGISTINFASLAWNFENGMMMFSPEGGMT